MGQQRRPCAQPMQAPPEPSPGGAPGGRLHSRLWEHPATAQDRQFVGGERGGFRLAPRDRLHLARVPEDQRNSCARPEVGQPIPGEEAFDADDELGPLGCHGVAKRCWASRHMPVDKTRAILVQEAEVHGAGLQLEATVNVGLFRVESHCGLLLSFGRFAQPQPTTW
jgi:hypothetical protein